MTDSFVRFRRTASMRDGLLAWYPFTGHESVLDLTDGYLSALLEQRGGSSTTTARRGDRFDLIVVTDPPDVSTEFLAGCRDHLAPGGKLLLAIENPFGLRYWAGHTSPRTGVRYATLLETNSYGPCSRATLSGRITSAGFSTGDISWYYPLADHWLCTQVFSDRHLPDESLLQRLVPYIDADAGRQFDEHRLLPEVIRNGSFPFLCPSFLVEARASSDVEPCPVRWATVTAYRPPGHRFATTIESDGFVYKRPLGEAAVAGLKRLADNHRELATLGVDVVGGCLTTAVDGTSVYRMAFIPEPTLQDHWANELRRDTLDTTDVVRHFDLLRAAIWRAARSGLCFWEMVPANCFAVGALSGSVDGLLFFDQEFCSSRHPPEVALLRAINSLRYSPILAEDERLRSLRADLLARYGLDVPGRDHERQLELLDTYLTVFGEEHREYQRLSSANAEALEARTLARPARDTETAASARPT